MYSGITYFVSPSETSFGLCVIVVCGAETEEVAF